MHQQSFCGRDHKLLPALQEPAYTTKVGNEIQRKGIRQLYIQMNVTENFNMQLKNIPLYQR